MLGLKALRARHLSRRGEHTAALSMCGLRDVSVLSKAGMHLTVLERSSRPSVERATALARIGEIDAAIEMAARFAGGKSARSLLGFLASAAPERSEDLVRSRSGLEGLYAFCLCASGRSEQAATIQAGVSGWHRLVERLRVGDLYGARGHFVRIFLEAGLSVPTFYWRGCGIDFSSLQSSSKEGEISGGPRISVVLTAHNEEDCLAVAVESLLAQSWRDIELVIVDDASSDTTGQIAAGFAERDPRVKLVSLEQNLGLWGAKNAGLQRCSGEIITSHDADDWSHRDKLALQVQPLLQHASLQATTSYMVRIEQSSGQPFTRNARNYLRWNPSSLMFRRSLLKESGGFIDKLLGSDCEFVDRLETRYGATAHCHLRLPLSIGLQRGGSLSNKFRDGSQALVRIRHWEDWRRWHVAGQLFGPALSCDTEGVSR